ncbi:MAG: hypothetical protein M3680_21545 [Myxococcota bacterium]|nr:hypothetical protein [Myxococcota bacterium]
MIRARGMTSSGMRWAFLLGFLMAFALPKRVPCGVPGRTCTQQGEWRLMCTPYELEPFGFYLLELVARRDIGFAYSTGEACR